ncbi:YncE family protein [Geofilum rubicundum]|uniref:BACON domain-containing protein n=1 Tax=Geofilum rubicundum JCM 15548 TaxID=1236989 RepID=A0A0E9LZ19_9BACT|nr:hypothetical protein [Geofilum rubicundum]GAO30361.1 hypothetical protein JCM15548_12626 [Geofilum rubicundum JCM 15548]
MCEGAGETEFRIERKPDWLILDAFSGKFSKDTAIIHGQAHAQADFSEAGVYIDQMLVSANGKKYAVPVYYITEGEPAVQVAGSLRISYDNGSNQLEIANFGDGVLLWDIVSMPDWLSVDIDRFNPMSLLLGQGGITNIPFKLNVERAVESGWNGLNGSIWLVTNDPNNQQVEVAVSADLGTPQLQIYSYYLPIEFGTTETSKLLNINNNGNGILAWHLEELPDWLSVSAMSGVCPAYSGIEISFICDRTQLEPGLNSATIYLKSNDSNNPSYPISVTARAVGNNVNIQALEGHITDASFDKGSNTLYYVTGQPNKLVAYDVNAREILYEVPLSKAPTCLALSEDYSKALVGHGGRISVVDMTSHSVTKTIEVSGILADIEWAAYNWCAYTESGDFDVQHTSVYWVNLSNGYAMEGSRVYEDCLIKKVPGQNYIIGSETEVSSGVYVYDIMDRSEKADIFESFDDFWFVGNYIISSKGRVYRLSDAISKDGYVTDGLSSIASLAFSGDSYYYTIPWMDYCRSSHSVFALKYQNYQSISPEIYQFEDNDFTLTQTYSYDNLYQPDAQAAPYEVQAHYLFSNSLGTELSVLRKGSDNNFWSIEFVPIQE